MNCSKRKKGQIKVKILFDDKEYRNMGGDLLQIGFAQAIKKELGKENRSEILRM